VVTVQVAPRRLGPADWVTTARLALAGAVAVLVAGSLVAQAVPLGGRPVGPLTGRPVDVLVGLASLALVLDGVDGWVARRTGTATAAGARYDMEVDAFLVLVLSAYAATTTAPWAILIGAARYLLLAAGWQWPWLAAETPPRYWAKVVAAVQGVVLVVVASGLLPRGAARLLLLAALVLLAESFGHQVRTLWRLREPVGPEAPRPSPEAPRTPEARGVRRRRAVSLATTVAAYAVLWLALALPHRPQDLTPGAFVRLPVELLAVVAVGALVPLPRVRASVCAVAGLLAGLLVVVKVADIGFYLEVDRPADLLGDAGLLGPALGVVRDSDGTMVAVGAAVGAVLAVVAVVGVVPLAAVRVGSSAARRRAVAVPVVAAVGAVWVAGAAAGLRVGGAPVASGATTGLALAQVRQVRADLGDHAAFAREIAADRFASTPGSQLLTGLRGKDVVVAFVESYGRVAVQDSPMAPSVDRVLDAGTRRLAAAGFSARSAFLTSPTFGGISWLAHSTLESGTWVDSSERYDQLLASHRLTLARAFHRAGWRTVFDIPSVGDGWPEGRRFYGFDRLYDASDVGYRGPSFGYASMPDQFTWAAFQHRELDRPHRRPLMAEIDLVSSHVPWTPLPRMVPWRAVGDGSVYDPMPLGQPSATVVDGDGDRVRAAYGASVRYTLRALVSFVRHDPDPRLVLVVLGDHQPNTSVSGLEAGHDVPVSVIAHDPRVLDRIAGWHWQPGLRPAPDAPVWRMDAFRDRFLSAFGSSPGGTNPPPNGANP
jgi:phosphatidylglycerophosphate synthase